MKTVNITSASGEKAGTAELPDEVFDAQTNIPLIHQVVVAQQAAARQGTHAAKTRGQVSGGGKKPYRQKGTGRARQGSIRAPHYVGGGTVHGPVPRSYLQRTPKKMKAAALRGALSERARNDRVHVVSAFTDADQPKTKDAVAVLASITGSRRGAGALVVLHRDDEAGWKSLRNVPAVHVLAVDQLNTYDVLASDHVVFTEQALSAFLGTRAGQGAGQKSTDEKEAQP
jgi:large subunit ribosomal protein L4